MHVRIHICICVHALYIYLCTHIIYIPYMYVYVYICVHTLQVYHALMGVLHGRGSSQQRLFDCALQPYAALCCPVRVYTCAYIYIYIYISVLCFLMVHYGHAQYWGALSICVYVHVYMHMYTRKCACAFWLCITVMCNAVLPYVYMYI